jgi:hypothetical protein
MSGIGPGASEDLQLWAQESTTQQHNALKEVRETAAAWEKSIAALFGVFGLVAFVKGPEKLADLDREPAIAVVFLTAVAAACTIVAVFLAARAAQGSPKLRTGLGGAAFRDLSVEQAASAATQLWISRFLALTAVTLVFVGVLVAWTSTLPSGTQEAEAKKVLVVSAAGDVSCGVLAKSAAGLALEPDGAGAAAPLPAVRQIVSVAACP